MENKSIEIEKFNGDIEEFDVEKLKPSLRRSKASEVKYIKLLKIFRQPSRTEYLLKKSIKKLELHHKT